jgi:hydrogenase maturation protein HypF
MAASGRHRRLSAAVAQPVAIATICTGYLSTKWAKHFGFRISDFRLTDEIQDKSANLISGSASPAPRRLPGRHDRWPGAGVTWDGTGYGTVGRSGAASSLGDAYRASICDRSACRAGHGVKEPRRVARALLWELFGDAGLEMEDMAPNRAQRPTERKLLAQMLAKGVNAPVTTSAGRLFDGIAALIGLHQQVSFEGQAAMALEFAGMEAARIR